MKNCINVGKVISEWVLEFPILKRATKDEIGVATEQEIGVHLRFLFEPSLKKRKHTNKQTNKQRLLLGKHKEKNIYIYFMSNVGHNYPEKQSHQLCTIVIYKASNTFVLKFVRFKNVNI